MLKGNSYQVTSAGPWQDLIFGMTVGNMFMFRKRRNVGKCFPLYKIYIRMADKIILLYWSLGKIMFIQLTMDEKQVLNNCAD